MNRRAYPNEEVQGEAADPQAGHKNNLPGASLSSAFDKIAYPLHKPQDRNVRSCVQSYTLRYIQDKL